MAEPSRLINGKLNLHQVCIVVHDLEKSIEHYQKIMGIGPWKVYDFDDSMLKDTTYHGRLAQYGLRAALCMVGSLQLELIQPLGGEKIYTDFLKEHGEGMHHMGHIRVDNMDEAIEAWEKEGSVCLQSGRIVDGESAGLRIAYIDKVKTLGTILELVEMP